MNARANLIVSMACLAVALTACTTSGSASIPDTLQPAASQSLKMVVAATGVQIYECRPSASRADFEWVFVAPEAQLVDDRGDVVGRHGTGPHWQAADGSRIVGTVKSRTEAPSTDTIPWLLLTTRSVGPAGLFSNVVSVQRVKTAGGAVPATPCTQATTGQTARVPYTAEYRMFVERG